MLKFSESSHETRSVKKMKIPQIYLQNLILFVPSPICLCVYPLPKYTGIFCMAEDFCNHLNAWYGVGICSTVIDSF